MTSARPKAKIMPALPARPRPTTTSRPVSRASSATDFNVLVLVIGLESPDEGSEPTGSRAEPSSYGHYSKGLLQQQWISHAGDRWTQLDSTSGGRGPSRAPRKPG